GPTAKTVHHGGLVVGRIVFPRNRLTEGICFADETAAAVVAEYGAVADWVDDRGPVVFRVVFVLGHAPLRIGDRNQVLRARWVVSVLGDAARRVGDRVEL